MANKDWRNSFLLYGYVSTFVGVLSMVVFFMSPATIVEDYKKEQFLLQDFLGDRSYGKINQKSKYVIDKGLKETGIYEKLDKLFEVEVKEGDDKRKGAFNWAMNWMDQRIDPLIYKFHNLIQRFLVLIEMLPIAVLFLVAGIVDGLTRRNIRYDTYQTPSTLMIRSNRFLLVATSTIGLLIFLSLPFTLNPYFYYAFYAVIAFSASQIAANARRVL